MSEPDRASSGKRRGTPRAASASSIVIAELQANKANISVRIAHKDCYGRAPCFDSAYRQAALLLAAQLPEDTKEALVRAYEPLRSPTALYNIDRVDTGIVGLITERVQLDEDEAKAQLENLKRAVELAYRDREMLRDFYPVPGATWPQPASDSPGRVKYSPQLVLRAFGSVTSSECGIRLEPCGLSSPRRIARYASRAGRRITVVACWN